MHCHEVQRLLEPFALGQLAPEDRRRVELHLAGCETCLGARARLEALVELLRSAPLPSAPEGFSQRVLAEARQRIKSRTRLPAPARTLPWWPAASVPLQAAALLLLGLGLVAGGFMGRAVGVRTEAQGEAQTARGHVAAEFNLDCLSEAPGGSLAGAYLRLALADDRVGE